MSRMRLLTLFLYCISGYHVCFCVPLVSSHPKHKGVEELQTGTSDLVVQSPSASDSSHVRHTRSLYQPPTDNETMEMVISALQDINSETNILTLREKALILGSSLSNNKSLMISDSLKSYVFNILSNITYVGNRNTTGHMIAHLRSSFEDELSSSRFNYTSFRLTDTDEQRLLRSLMTNYEKAVRPVLRASDPITLKIGLTLNQIDLEEKYQVLTTLVWLDQDWIDEKLIWDPQDYNNLTVLRVPCRLLWLPDIVLYNSVEDMKGGYMQALAMVSHNGNVFWPPIVKFKGACEVQIKYFPFDDQTCKLKLGTWSYDGSQVNLTKRRDGIDLNNFQPNGEWRLLGTKVVRNVVYYPCCEAPYIDVTFEVFMRRRTLYYTYNLIIPCVMLSILTLLCFWMKPDSGEKISLGLTILLAFSVFMLLIAENMPSTSVHVPIIGIYITSSMCITAFSVIVGVIVANVNHQADGDREVPYWIHKVSYTLSKITCVKMTSYEERHFNIKKLAQVLMPAAHNRREGPGRLRNRHPLSGNNVKSDSPAETNHIEHEKIADERAKEETIKSMETDPLLKRLHSIVQHQEELLHKQNTTEDWHFVAIVIDRCLFWLYLLMMLSSTIGCLVIFPLTKEYAEDFDKPDHPS